MESFERLKARFFDELCHLPTFEDGYSLTPLEHSYSEYIVDWRNDPENLELFESTELITLQSQYSFMSTYDKRNRVDLVLLSNDLPIGIFNIKNLDAEPEYGALIGDRSYRGIGLANKVKRSILDYWFKIIGEEIIFTKIRSKNNFLIRSNLKFGFKIIREDGDITVLKLHRREWIKMC